MADVDSYSGLRAIDVGTMELGAWCPDNPCWPATALPLNHPSPTSPLANFR